MALWKRDVVDLARHLKEYFPEDGSPAQKRFWKSMVYAASSAVPHKYLHLFTTESEVHRVPVKVPRACKGNKNGKPTTRRNVQRSDGL